MVPNWQVTKKENKPTRSPDNESICRAHGSWRGDLSTLAGFSLAMDVGWLGEQAQEEGPLWDIGLISAVFKSWGWPYVKELWVPLGEATNEKRWGSSLANYWQTLCSKPHCRLVRVVSFSFASCLYILLFTAGPEIRLMNEYLTKGQARRWPALASLFSSLCPLYIPCSLPHLSSS